MNIDEAISRIETEGHYTDENLKDLENALLGAQPKDFNDPAVRAFMRFVNKRDFDRRVQDIVSNLVDYMNEKGIDIPCAHGCNESCEFHEEEFGNK